MTVLRRLFLASTALAISTFLPASVRAQDAAPAGGSIHDEIKALRTLVEQQSKQILTLSDQIARLTVQLDNRAAAVAVPGGIAARPADFAVPAARVVQPAAPPANVHIMVKGDSLDKVARTYNTTVAELLKINKITDPKKLQVGQQIILPPNATPAAPAPAPAGNPAEQ